MANMLCLSATPHHIKTINIFMENLGFSFHLAGAPCLSATPLHIKTRNVFLKYLLLVLVGWRQPCFGKRLVHPISLVRGVFRIVGCGFNFHGKRAVPFSHSSAHYIKYEIYFWSAFYLHVWGGADPVLRFRLDLAVPVIRILGSISNLSIAALSQTRCTFLCTLK